MPEVRINAGAMHLFAAGLLGDTLQLDNRHNVNGAVAYQIAAQPAYNVPIVPNQDYAIQNIHGLQVQVWNNLPSSLYCVW